MPWAVAYTQDLNPASAITVLATLVTIVLMLGALTLLHRKVLPAWLGLLAAISTPFFGWAIAATIGNSGMPAFSGTLHHVNTTIIAAVPVLVLFYLLVSRRWLASAAGAAGAVAAILLAGLVYGMPFGMAGWAFVHGAVFGLLPIGWTVFAAMMLYNLTVETGQFTIIRRSIAGLSGDARVQAILIGFCFGAFLEGAAGAGSPVAICGAMLVGLGVPPIRAAVICLLANTSPVCYGGLGVPILTLSSVTGIEPDKISVMCGHQLPFLSCLIPLYMVKVMCSWRQTFAVWPALVVGGGSFAIVIVKVELARQFVRRQCRRVCGCSLTPKWRSTTKPKCRFLDTKHLRSAVSATQPPNAAMRRYSGKHAAPARLRPHIQETRARARARPPIPAAAG